VAAGEDGADHAVDDVMLADDAATDLRGDLATRDGEAFEQFEVAGVAAGGGARCSRSHVVLVFAVWLGYGRAEHNAGVRGAFFWGSWEGRPRERLLRARGRLHASSPRPAGAVFRYAPRRALQSLSRGRPARYAGIRA